jgi:hypothetical protein
MVPTMLLHHSLFQQVVNDPGVALNVAKYPASGAFIDVSDYDYFEFFIAAGSVADALTMQVEEATAADGTPSDISGAVTTFGTDEDNEQKSIVVETRKMTINSGYRYVTLDVTGPSGTNHAMIQFRAWRKGSEPVTQHTDYSAQVAVVG